MRPGNRIQTIMGWGINRSSSLAKGSDVLTVGTEIFNVLKIRSPIITYKNLFESSRKIFHNIFNSSQRSFFHGYNWKGKFIFGRLFYENQKSRGHEAMNSVRVTLAFMIVLVGVLLATGCTGPAFGNSIANGTVTISPSTLVTQLVQTECPSPSGNVTSWIIINPISIHHKAEIFEINGTTNLGPNEKLRYTISRGGVIIPIPGPNGGSYNQYDNGAENISYGEFSISKDQKWSFRLDSSGPEYYNPYGAAFFVNVSSKNLSINNSTYFYLK